MLLLLLLLFSLLFFLTACDDAGICIAKVLATSRKLGTLTYRLFFFTVFCLCSSTFLGICAVPRSATFFLYYY